MNYLAFLPKDYERSSVPQNAQKIQTVRIRMLKILKVWDDTSIYRIIHKFFATEHISLEEISSDSADDALHANKTKGKAKGNLSVLGFINNLISKIIVLFIADNKNGVTGAAGSASGSGKNFYLSFDKSSIKMRQVLIPHRIEPTG